jgi:hypothetical protein
LRRPFLVTTGLFFLLCPLCPVSLGALKAVIRFAHDYASYPAAVGLDLRKVIPDRGWAWTRHLCEAIQASAAASVSNRLTVAGLASWIVTLTPKPPAASGTIS